MRRPPLPNNRPLSVRILPPLKSRPPQPYWPEVLTDWCVITALDASGWPPPFEESKAIQAAFASETSAYLRLWGIGLREAEAESRIIAAMEDAHERSDPVTNRTAMAAFEREKSVAAGLNRERPAGVGPSNAGGETFAASSPLAVNQHWATESTNRCGRATPTVHAVRRQAAQTYWQAVAACRIPDDFFAKVAPDSVLAKVPFRFATWWGLFVLSLRRVVQRTNPAVGRLLQELPHLRAEAAKPGQKLVLSALVQDWREAHAERFGLFQDIHFPVLEQRSFAKAHAVNEWFESRVPGYTCDARLRAAAAQTLRATMGFPSGDREAACWNN